MVIKKELLDELFASVENPQDLMGEDGLLKELKKALLERAMNAELDEHLGYAKNAPAGRNNGNSRNGHGRKTIVGEDGEMVIATPRDRDATFDPQIIKKGQRRFEGIRPVKAPLLFRVQFSFDNSKAAIHRYD